jgi:hypothetical protein
MISPEKLANNIRRVHSHGRIPPCVDDSYRRRNHLAMYVILDILWTMFHVLRLECVLTACSTLVGWMLLIIPTNPQYLPHIYVL